MPFGEREILASFSTNNTFYIVTLHAKEDRMVFYAFANGRYTSHEADLAEAGFTSASAKQSTFRALLERHDLQKIDRRVLQDLKKHHPK
jgi:arylamine N-acetyltransferase